MNERLAQFMKLEGLTAVKFAEIMEVQPSSISHLLSGRNKPNFEFISRILLRFPQLNPDWIINGIGPVYKSKPEPSVGNITNVNIDKVTNVNQPIKDENQDKESSIITDNPPQEQLSGPVLPNDDLFTNVNASNPVEPHLDPDISLERDSHASDVVSIPPTKSIERIVIFFSDGSFKSYQN